MHDSGGMNNLKITPDEDIARMIRQAWNEACRAWRDARAARGANTYLALLDEARLAEAYWRSLYDERRSRRGIHGPHQTD